MSTAFDSTDEPTRNAVIAGLRLLQAWKENRTRSSNPEFDVSIDDIETNGGSAEPLTVDQIDDLCEAINLGDIQIVEENDR